MHPLQCHGPFHHQPFSMLPTDPASSPSSTSSPTSSSFCSSSDVRLDSACSVTSSDHCQTLTPLSPNPPDSRRKLKRRASQDSVLQKPSSVSRFLSRNPPATGPAAKPGQRTRSVDSRFSFRSSAPSTSSTPSPSSPSQAALSIWQTNSEPYPSTLPPTPPEDNDDQVAWPPDSGMLLLEQPQLGRPQGLGQPPSSMDETTPRAPLTADGLSGLSDQLSSAAASPPTSTAMDCDYDNWLENGVHAAVSSLPFSDTRGETVKIVSHTLPYPRAAEKSVILPTHDSVFSVMVQAVQNRMRQGQSSYINITHAVPEQFSLSNLPSSPPSTPLTPGEDYFNSTVFSNAAVVSTYHDFRGPVLGMQASHSPMPVVPPHTVQLSVLERYLPPSSVQEYKDLFSLNRPSYLVDRICELSPDGGSLLFIYPTRRGGHTFKGQYLGPILDPLLRQLVVVNELSADVSRYLGKLSSVSSMDDFERMKDNLSNLCDALSSVSSSNFSVADARKGTAHLDRNLWTEWFIHQEKARMKEILNLYWQNGRRLPVNKTSTSGTMRSNFMLADKEVTSAMLLGDILDGIRRRPYGEENERQDGVELGVFVIRRSR